MIIKKTRENEILLFQTMKNYKYDGGYTFNSSFHDLDLTHEECWGNYMCYNSNIKSPI